MQEGQQGHANARAFIHTSRRDGPTYLATREHPVLGLLLKVGSSTTPDKRCGSLGAKRFGPLLRHHCESDLHALLKHRRAWPDMTFDEWFREPPPIFTAPTEWFYADAETSAILRAYLRTQTIRVAA